MITITRRQARSLRGILRRSVLGISSRGSIPPLVLRAEGTQLRVQYQYSSALAVEHVEPGNYPSHEAIALPLDALADFESRVESLVVIEATAPDRTVVRWEDHGIPQTREYTVQPPDHLDPLPELPGSWVNVPAGLLDALAEATATGAAESTLYALNCIELRGESYEVIATDGRQLLVTGGFRFPWTTNVLIRNSPLFGCRELPRDQPLSMGKTDTHVVLGVGLWALIFAIQTDGRFPPIDQIIPEPQGVATRLLLDAADAVFLGRALDRLPGAEELHGPVTLDCHGRIAVRARAAVQTQVTELVLSRSQYAGNPVRLPMDRAYLARALRLGFTELEITDADTPLVCRSGQRIYAWQPLPQESAIAPSSASSLLPSPPPSGRMRRHPPKG